MTLSVMKKINKKIPGNLPPPPKNEIDGKITDLSSKTLPQLLELRDRQLKLLNNKSFICKLGDKGAKIQALYDTIVKEIKAKKDEEQACALMNRLKLDNLSNTVQEVEWEGTIKNRTETFLDSDDDSEPEDVLQILGKSTSHEKKIKVIQPEKTLVTLEDLKNIGEVPHVKYIVDKTENHKNPKVDRQFKPYQTTISNVHLPEKEILRKKHKHWEVTAATPPPSVCGPAKVLSLEESLKLQHEYNIHIKQVEAQHAADKLMSKMGMMMKELPNDRTNFTNYREADSDDSGHSDYEVHDEEPDRGGVVFTVMK